MLKQAIALILLSAAIILSMSYAQQGLQLLLNGHEWVAGLLTEVFSAGQYGNLVRSLIALLSIPIIAGFIPTIAYWVVKRHWFPYFMEIVWVVWLIQAGALIMMYKAAVAA